MNLTSRPSSDRDTLEAVFLRACERRPADVAALDDAGALTYAQLRAAALGLAASLPQKTERANVGVLFPSCKEFGIAYFGALLAGKTPTLLNLLMQPEQLGWIARHAELDLAITSRKLAPLIEPIGVNVLCLEDTAPADTGEPRSPAFSSPNDLATLIYTSGTEADPKGVMLSHRNLLSNASACRERLRIQPEDVVLIPLPLFHTFALTTGLLLPLLSGARTVYMPRFSPGAMLKRLAEHRVTCVMAVPSMFRLLTLAGKKAPCDLSSLRVCVAGGEPLHPDVRLAFEEAFSQPLLEGYGLTETSPVISANTPDANRPGTAGRVFPGVEVRILDDAGSTLANGLEGQVFVRGENIMLGYYKLPEKTAEVLSPDGWFRTGDMGMLLDGGYLKITGRRKEMIICSGENVWPGEIENVLIQHPAVSEAAVVGVPDNLRGETPKAFVALQPGAKCAVEELLGHCRQKLPRFKSPREIEIRDELPHGPTGKVLRRALHRL